MKDLMKYIPLDKSWMIRVGMLDLVHGKFDIIDYLRQQKDLSNDLMALKRVAENWRDENAILDVGESATLLRFVKFILWKEDKKKAIVTKGTLVNREICDNPEIVDWSLEDLLKLDNGTSQWASASVLMGNQEEVENPPMKLRLTHSVVKHWNEMRKKGRCWIPKLDSTIELQARAYIGWLEIGEMNFQISHSEDYCFARAFDLIDAEEGEKRFPSLRGHETDRIEEMERALSSDVIDSKDHRVIQAVFMKHRGEIAVKNRTSVRKSWPRFFEFVKEVENDRSEM